jgi:nicotinate-nucleotide adenylyltransferase
MSGPVLPASKRAVAWGNGLAPQAEASAPGSRLRIGLLGGSFNPAHAGHLALSLEALKRLRLDRVWWLVSPQNPLKPASDMADLDSRMASARAMIGGQPRLLVTDLEQRIGTRYSIDTLCWLKHHHDAKFVWLIGADNLAQMPRWRRWRELIGLVAIAVFDREPYSHRAVVGRMATAYARRCLPERDAAALIDREPPAWVYLRLRRFQESSTAIRLQRRDGGRPRLQEGRP